jgi:hypothetical protein
MDEREIRHTESTPNDRIRHLLSRLRDTAGYRDFRIDQNLQAGNLVQSEIVSPFLSGSRFCRFLCGLPDSPSKEQFPVADEIHSRVHSSCVCHPFLQEDQSLQGRQ